MKEAWYIVLFYPYIGPLLGATTPGQSGPGINGNEGVFRIPQISSIAGTSPSDCLVSLSGYLLEGSYPSAEKQSVYSTVPADWAIRNIKLRFPSMGYSSLTLQLQGDLCVSLSLRFYLSINFLLRLSIILEIL